MKRFRLSFCLLFTAALFALFLLSPDVVQQTAYESVLFSASVIIPSLFPGFVLSDLLIGLWQGNARSSGGLFFRIFRLPSPCFRCWLIGLFAGFPAATDCAVQAYRRGEISRFEAERCLSFTNNPGIIFVVCAVGSGLFGSFSVGIYLWSIQTLAAVLVGIFFADPVRKPADRAIPVETIPSLKTIFPKSVVSSVGAVLNICGFIVFFRVLIAVLTNAVPLRGIRIVLSGLLEMTCGITAWKEFSYFSALAVSLILGWSGFSVHFQILNLLSETDLSPRYYFPGKILQAVLSALLSSVTYPFFFDSGECSQGTAIPFILLAFALLSVFITRFRKEYPYGKRNF